MQKNKPDSSNEDRISKTRAERAYKQQLKTENAGLNSKAKNITEQNKLFGSCY